MGESGVGGRGGSDCARGAGETRRIVGDREGARTGYRSSGVEDRDNGDNGDEGAIKAAGAWGLATSGRGVIFNPNGERAKVRGDEMGDPSRTSTMGEGNPKVLSQSFNSVYCELDT